MALNRLFKQKPLRLFLGLFILVITIGFYRTEIPALEGLRDRLEWLGFDLRLQIMADPVDSFVDDRITILDIDDYSIEEIGRWPWTRTHMAELIAKLTDAGAAVIGLDMFFSEYERNPLDESARLLETSDEPTLLQIAEFLHPLAEANDADVALGEVVADAPIVLGYAVSGNQTNPVGVLPPAKGEIDPELAEIISVPIFESYIANIKPIGEDMLGGFLTFQPDRDGVLRRVPLVLGHEGKIYPSLALASVMEYMALEEVELVTAMVDGAMRLEEVSLEGAITVPSDPYGRAVVPFPRHDRAFRYLSAAKFLAGEYDPSDIEDAIILIGSTATGIWDMRATPVGGVYPGIEVHAVLISAILNGTIPYAADWAEGVDIVVIVGLGLFTALVFPFIGLGPIIFISLFLLFAYGSVNFSLWHNDRLILSLMLPLLIVSLTGGINVVIGFIQESIQKQRLKSSFGQYIPPQLVEQLQGDTEATNSLEGQSRELSVLFSDIRGFTGLSEAMSADHLKQMLNIYFTPMTKIIFDSRGTIDKYVGDMIMAFWGAPIEDPDHRIHSIEAALHMLEKVEELQPQMLELSGGKPVRSGIGINTGMMNVGDMGSEYRRAYTVLGDSVNLGSRLEGLCKHYGVELIVSEYTLEGIADVFLHRPVDKVTVKGRKEPIRIFQPLCKMDQADDALVEEVAEFHRGFNYYLEGEMDQALHIMQKLIIRNPRVKLYHIFTNRIKRMQHDNVELDNWTGVFKHTSK